MSSRQPFAWWLDAGLFVAYLLLVAPHLTGLALHEWLGVALVPPVLLHLLLSWRWVQTAMWRLTAPHRRRDAVNLVLNTVLFVTTTVVVASGIAISQVAMPLLGATTIDDRVWRGVHNRWNTWMLYSLAAHLAMNWRWIVTQVRRLLSGRADAQ